MTGASYGMPHGGVPFEHPLAAFLRGAGMHRHRCGRRAGFAGGRGPAVEEMRGWGPPPRPGGPGFGPGGGGRGGPRGRRARRGDIRSAILLLLSEEPRNGYGLMQEVEERSGGLWRPSPGSVYPALAQLEDEGLVAPVEHEGRKASALTDAGREHVEANRERFGAPWETVGGAPSDELQELRQAAEALAVAAMQVAHTGTDPQLTEAKDILQDARRRLYRLLAGDPPDTPAT